MFERRRHPRLSLFRGSLAGLCAPLSTLRGWPRGQNLAHDSGSMWIATPSSWWTCTTYFLPVSRRTRTREMDNDNITQFPPRSAREKGTNGATVFPAHARTGDPNSPLEAYPLMRSHARLPP